MVICYPTLLTNVSALPEEARTPEIVSFLVILYTVSRKQHGFSLLYLQHSSSQYLSSTFHVHVAVHVHVSPGSAETVLKRGGIANYRLIACSPSNISAKNYLNRFICIEVILCYISVAILRHSVLSA